MHYIEEIGAVLILQLSWCYTSVFCVTFHFHINGLVSMDISYYVNVDTITYEQLHNGSLQNLWQCASSTAGLSKKKECPRSLWEC